MSSTLLAPPVANRDADAALVRARMEAATQALLRARDEVIAALDQQVAELQNIHRALAYSPAPFIVADEPDTQPIQAPLSLSGALASAGVAPHFPAPPIHVDCDSTESPLSQNLAPLIPFDAPLPNGTLDPILERATLEELNAALANAFASVSGRR